MAAIAHLRVSTGTQDLDQQRLATSDYAQKQRLTVDEFVETKRSSQHAAQRRELMEKVEALQRGDRLIVSELSRLGRSLGQILHVIDRLIHQGVHLVSIKESIRFEGKRNLQTKAMIVLFGLFAEDERDLIVERTKEGLAGARGARQAPRLAQGGAGQVEARRQGRRYPDVSGKEGFEGLHRPHHGGLADHPASLRQDAEASGGGGLIAVTWRESTFLNNQTRRLLGPAHFRHKTHKSPGVQQRLQGDQEAGKHSV